MASALEDAERQGHRILACSAASSEVQLSFTALRDLLGPRSTTSRTRFRRRSGALLRWRCFVARPRGPPGACGGRGGVAHGAPRSLRARPDLLVAIDDVQWLDPASALVIQYSARRLLHEPIWLLLTVRTEASAPPPDLLRTLGQRTHRIEVGPLSLGALQRLLGARVGRTFARPALRRIHEASGGNPFFALELARVLDEYSLVGDVLPVPETLRELVRGRLGELP